MFRILMILTFFGVLTLEPVRRIHHPYRLYLLDPYKKVTGVVKKVDQTIDGDIHIRLDIDDKTLLVERNYKKEDSCLVLEIVCGCKSIFPICNGYENKILVPNVGDTITATGLFVYDKIHKINEIHPVLGLIRK